ncbi:vitamin K epoxide reductase complex subunit 1-like [Dryobates pubescens]|uniref:vitamin K epoxide reductase complex subunit 1-like n=1 Tax=Dryobates pubescens TaxID=118200 RepID=UPI0023B8E1FA|nr:vitamin K epoxide reductase complex subunit 1-like [Dryobates pubescens]
MAAAWPGAARAALCAVGVALSLYALHVERAHARDPAYRAACDLAPAVSCTRVFASRWGRGLGLVELLLGRESFANLPNSALGVLFYLLQGLLGALPGRGAAALLLGSSVASLLASAWLAAILAFGLRDLCVVCLGSYLLNGLLLALNWQRWRRLPRPKAL